MGGSLDECLPSLTGVDLDGILKHRMETPDVFMAQVYARVRATIQLMPSLSLSEKKGQYGIRVSHDIRKAFRDWMDTSKTFTSLPLTERSTVTYLLAVFVAMSLQNAGSDNDSRGSQASVNCRMLCCTYL